MFISRLLLQVCNMQCLAYCQKLILARLSFKPLSVRDMRLLYAIFCCFVKCARRGDSGTSLAAKRFEQQRQQELLQHVPLRQFDDCNCYATKMMTMATTIPSYDCPCGVPESAITESAGRIPLPPPPLLLPVGGTATCDVCGRALSGGYGGDETHCRCDESRCSGDESHCRCAGVWESPYSRLPLNDTGSHVTYMSTTATGSRRRAVSPRLSDVTGVTIPLDHARHVTMASALGDVGCTLTSARRDDTASRRVTSDAATA